MVTKDGSQHRSSLQPSQEVVGSAWSAGWRWVVGVQVHGLVPLTGSSLLNISVGEAARFHGGALKLKAAAIKRADDWILL